MIYCDNTNCANHAKDSELCGVKNIRIDYDGECRNNTPISSLMTNKSPGCHKENSTYKSNHMSTLR